MIPLISVIESACLTCIQKTIPFAVFFSFPFASFAQHYIVREQGDTIFCRINKVDDQVILYSDTGRNQKSILRKEVSGISTPGYSMGKEITEQKPEPDTTSLAVLKNELTALTIEMERIKSNLYHAHANYRSGTGFIILGSAITFASSIYGLASGNNIDYKDPNALKKINTINKLMYGTAGLGGLLSFLGLAIQIDSHRHIGTAGGFNP